MKLYYQRRLTKGNAFESVERLVFDAVEARLLFSAGGQRSLGETSEKIGVLNSRTINSND